MKKPMGLIITASLALSVISATASYALIQSFNKVDPNNGMICEAFTSDCGYCLESVKSKDKDGIYSRGWPFKTENQYFRCGTAYSLPINWYPILQDTAIFFVVLALPPLIYFGRKDYENSRH